MPYGLDEIVGVNVGGEIMVVKYAINISMCRNWTPEYFGSGANTKLMFLEVREQ